MAELKLGISVTEKEADIILSMKKTIDEKKAKWDPVKSEAELAENPTSKTAGWASEEERLAYGFSLDGFKEFVGRLKLAAEQISIKERFQPKNFGRNVIDLASVTKSLVATLDNSFLGRQGLKTLLVGKIKIWGTTVKESFKNF